MKILKVATLVAILITGVSWKGEANNIKVDTQPVVCNANFAQDYAYVKFDLSWDNSWRDATNWDAAWIFVKYRVGANGAWNHAYLSTTGTEHSVGTDNGAAAQFSVGSTNISGTDYGMGVFACRANNGTGSINWDKVMLRWNYGQNGVGDNDTVMVKVFAIEMCYVPQGSFWVGNDTLQELNSFRVYGGINPAPFNITSQSSISLGNTAGKLYWTYSTCTNCGIPSGNSDPLFPTGFNAFYCMKYETTQEQYVDFLNTLTRSQQWGRVGVNISPGTTTLANVYVLSVTAIVNNRNSVRAPSAFDANAPLVFFNDLNGNGIGGENDDGQTLGLNTVNWGDNAAYLDWCALRPMTEFEYEKACRGTGVPVVAEAPWGNSTFNKISGVISGGQPSEVASTTPTNCNANNGYTLGPTRAGMFALAATNRTDAGGSVYGIMDLAGSLWERVITTGNATGLAYTGNHGDGTIQANGDFNTVNWPSTSGVGTGLRGAAYSTGATSLNWHTSSRQAGANGSNVRGTSWGFRGVRSAP